MVVDAPRKSAFESPQSDRSAGSNLMHDLGLIANWLCFAIFPFPVSVRCFFGPLRPSSLHRAPHVGRIWLFGVDRQPKDLDLSGRFVVAN